MTKIIVVLGMHRSGTSAVAGLLAASGAQCGAPLLPADDGNPTGYWELADLVAENDAILAALHRGWRDAAPMPADWQDLPAVRQRESAAARLLQRQFDGARLACIKDPRLCLTMPFWRRVILRLGWSVGVVAVARPMGEVVRSVRARYELGAEHIAYLWARYTLEASRAALHDPAVVLTYDQVLESPARSLQSVAARLGVSLLDHAASGVIDGALRHHTAPEPPQACDAGLAAFCDRLYTALAESARAGALLGAARLHDLEATLVELDRRVLLPHLQAELWQCRSIVDGLTAQVASARKSHVEVEGQLERSRAQNGQLVLEIAAARQTHDRLLAEIRDARLRHDGLVDEIAAAERAHDATAREIAAARSSIDNLTAQLGTARSNIENLQLEIEQARAAHRERDHVEAGLRARAQTLEAEMAAARAGHEDLEAQIGCARTAIEALTNELEIARRQHGDLDRQLAQARIDHRDLDAQVRQARRTNADLATQIDAARSRHVNLEGQLESSRVVIADLQSQIASARTGHEDLQGQVEGARHTIATLRRELEEQVAELRTAGLRPSPIADERCAGALRTAAAAPQPSTSEDHPGDVSW